MGDDQLLETHEPGRFSEHKCVILVVGTILLSLALVAVSLWLYNTSGTAQLDLSRPDYESARSQEAIHTNFDSFSANGGIDTDVLDAFAGLYDDQLKEAKALDAFGGDVMSNVSLGIDPAPAQ